MKAHAPLVQILLFVALLCCGTSGHSQSKAVSFDIFSSKTLSKSDLVHEETPTARPRVIKRGKQFFQVFTDKRTGRELFRIFVGTDEATYWVYGLIQENDYNGDGIPDFCWHGGDDTTNENLILLSSPSGYVRVDINQSLQREWTRRFPSNPLKDLNEADTTADVTEVRLVRQSGKLFLTALISYTDIFKDDIKTYTHRVPVPESRFVHVK